MNFNVPSGAPETGASDDQVKALQKYSIDGPFVEPVVRCDACQELLVVAQMRRIGKCTSCGNTRVRNVTVMQDTDMEKVTQWAADGVIDPDWVKLFAGVQ